MAHTERKGMFLFTAALAGLPVLIGASLLVTG
jgi:hypothetical protein